MRLIQGIDFFYHEDTRNLLIIGCRDFLYGAQCSSDDLLSMLCEAHGRSVKGSMELFAKINHAHQKLAVLVNPSAQEIYFPTHASTNQSCIWVNFGRISHFETSQNNQCMIHFNNGSKLAVSCSARVVARQMKRCSRLLNSLCNPYEKINELFLEV